MPTMSQPTYLLTCRIHYILMLQITFFCKTFFVKLFYVKLFYVKIDFTYVGRI